MKTVILGFFLMTSLVRADEKCGTDISAAEFCSKDADAIVSGLVDFTAPAVCKEIAKNYSSSSAVGYHVREKGLLLESSEFLSYQVGLYGSKILDYHPGTKIMSGSAPKDKVKKKRRRTREVVERAKQVLQCPEKKRGDDDDASAASVEDVKMKSSISQDSTGKTSKTPSASKSIQ